MNTINNGKKRKRDQYDKMESSKPNKDKIEIIDLGSESESDTDTLHKNKLLVKKTKCFTSMRDKTKKSSDNIVVIDLDSDLKDNISSSETNISKSNDRKLKNVEIKHGCINNHIREMDATEILLKINSILYTKKNNVIENSQKPISSSVELNQEELYHNKANNITKKSSDNIVVIDMDSDLKDNISSSETNISKSNDRKLKNVEVKHECTNNHIREMDATEILLKINSILYTKKNNVIENSQKPISSSVEELNQEEIHQYVGNISDLDFDDTEFDQFLNNQCTNTVVNSQNKIDDKSEVEENENTELQINKKTSNNLKTDLNTEPKKTLTLNTLSDSSLAHSKIIEVVNDHLSQFFWMDAFEDAYNHPGNLYLFGKTLSKSTNDFVSCCIVIKNIPRRIYVLPRKYVVKGESENDVELNSFSKVYDELKAYFHKHNVDEFRCKEVIKTYVFEKKNIPESASYLEVKYSAPRPILDANYSGPTIQAVFGASFNALELFLVDKNIKGPCWLDVKTSHKSNSAFTNNFSWCKSEINGVKLEDVSVVQNKEKIIPPIVVATLNIQVSFNSKNENEVISVGILVHCKYEFGTLSKTSFNHQYCLVTHSKCADWPKKVKEKIPKIKETKIIYCETEYELLEKLLDILHSFDPDVIVGRDSEFQYEVLISKIFKLRIKNWSKIGKLKMLKQPHFKGKIYLNQILCGRPICDIVTTLQELNFKTTSYDLPSLCSSVLNQTLDDYIEIKPEDCLQYYSSVEKFENFLNLIISTTSYVTKIAMELNLLHLAFELTKVAGSTLSRILLNGVSDRNDFLLLHAFHANNYILPDKKIEKENALVDKTSTFSGGLVLELKEGYFDKIVLLMDFNSLYPSIIQEFNVCFTTIPCADRADVDSIQLSIIKNKTGILPTEISKLVESRAHLKKMLESPNLSPELKRQYNTRQLALKLMANSIYGCLGANYSRFYAKGLAAFVAMKGREILLSTKELVQAMNYEIIYGDTDSIMINTKSLDYELVINIGRDIKRRVNQMYRKIELDIDHIFRYLLLIKKKQYAALAIQKLPNGEFQYSKEIKGLEVIRRDRCDLACDCGNQILDQLLSDKLDDLRLKNIFNILENTSKVLQSGKVPLSSLKIIKRLSKDPEKYLENTNQSHVIVAKRLNKTSARKWKAGDLVPYVICEDGTQKAPQERAYHIDELKKNNLLKIDVKYYLTRQIYPIIVKICNSINGIDDSLVAQHLEIGELNQNIHQGGDKPSHAQENRFNDCLPFIFTCQSPNCRTENQIKTVITEVPMGKRFSLEKCSNLECSWQPWKHVYTIKNKLQIDIRKFVSKYYFGEIKCDNSLCFKIVRRVSLDASTGILKCHNCFDGNLHRIYDESNLYNQLNFFLYIFSVNQSHCENLNTLPKVDLIDAYNSIKEFIIDEIENNAYGIIDLSKLYYSNVEDKSVKRLNNIAEDTDIM